MIVDHHTSHGIPSLPRAEVGINVIIGGICTSCQPEVFAD